MKILQVRLACGLMLAGAMGAPVGLVAQAASAWKLAWSDEFTGPRGAYPDPAKWKFLTGSGPFGNEEAETYCKPGVAVPAPCSAEQPNAYLDGAGHLVLEARLTNQTIAVGPKKIVSPVYTSARMVSIPDFQYGRLEASIRLPVAAKGVWPAFWALGQQTRERQWPAVGEIDMMEQWNPQPGSPGTLDGDTVHGSVHGPLTPGSGVGFLDQSKDFVLPGPASNGMHQYAVEWSPGKADFYVDGYFYYSSSVNTLTGTEVWPLDSGPFSLLLNLAMGGGFFGYPDAATGTSSTMLVEYVRVYQRDPGVLQPGWSNADIGGPREPGSSTFEGGTDRVSGGGSGTSGSTDQFQLAYVPLTADGEVSARVLGQSDATAKAEAGVMLRDARGIASPFAAVFITPGGRVHFRYRTARGERSAEVHFKGTAAWLKLVRHGDVFVGLASADGKRWTRIGDARIAMPPNLLAGLAVSCGDDRTPDTARFSSVIVARSL
jgi:beta-glucanase (GH16 family)